QPRGQLVADEAGRVDQRPEHAIALRLGSEDAHVDARQREVPRDLDVGHADHAREPGVADSVREDPGHLALEGRGHSVGTDPHGRRPSQSSSSAPWVACTRDRPDWSCSSTWWASAETTATPSAARCHRSWWSTSATAARTRWRM